MILGDLDRTTAGLDDWFVEALNSLIRGEATDLDSYLISVGEATTIGQTKTSCQIKFLTRDGNGRPNVHPLTRMLADQIVDYCIPRSRINEARARLASRGSTDQLMALQREARDLFTAIDTSGEGGELLLAVLLERLLGAPQILCKMSLKTNSEVHVHGADGVHARAIDGGGLELYWGESKLHDTVSSAIASTFDSIGPFLTDDGSGAARRDLLLVRNHLDTGSPEVDQVLREFFVDGSLSSNRRVVRGASLVGFSLTDYPHPLGEDGNVAESLSAAIASWHELVKKRVTAKSLDEFDITVFCLPVPSVSAFRQSVKEALGI